jgi:hypothetical protein
VGLTEQDTQQVTHLAPSSATSRLISSTTSRVWLALEEANLRQLETSLILVPQQIQAILTPINRP